MVAVNPSITIASTLPFAQCKCMGGVMVAVNPSIIIGSTLPFPQCKCIGGMMVDWNPSIIIGSTLPFPVCKCRGGGDGALESIDNYRLNPPHPTVQVELCRGVIRHISWYICSIGGSRFR